jgi:hypothetical protein
MNGRSRCRRQGLRVAPNRGASVEICLGRNDGMRRSGMRGRNYTPFAIASSGQNKTSSPFGPKTLPDSCLERDCVGALGAKREKYAKRCLSITRKVTEATSED